jgi:serine/threonine-protein kinase
LINTSDGYHVWSHTFDRKLQDVFALQDELARAIVTSLQLRLMGDSVIVQVATSDPVAHDLYLKGRFFWNRPGEANFRRAIGYFQQALERDSTYALAHAGLADCYYLLGAHGYLPPKEVLPRAKAAALTALALDSTLAEAHISLGNVARWWDWDRELAERQFQRAISLNPRYAEAYRFHAWLLADQVDSAGAIREMRRALALDPLSPLINIQLGNMLLFGRQYDSALAQYHRTLELDSTMLGARGGLAEAYRRMGRLEDAFREAAVLLNEPTYEQSWQGHLLYLGLYITAGQRARAREELETIHEIARRRYVRPGVFAAAYTMLGERDRAFAWLEQGVRERALGPQVRMEVVYDSLHSDPRWARIVSAMNLTGPAPR